jgi:hypothetical protein
MSHDPRTDSSEGVTCDDTGALSGAGSISHDPRTSSTSEETGMASGAAGSDSAGTAFGTPGRFGSGTECRSGSEPDGGEAEAACVAGADGDGARAGRMDRACRRTSFTRASLIEDVDPLIPASISKFIVMISNQSIVARDI